MRIYNGCVHVVVVVLILILFAIAFVALLAAARSIGVATGPRASSPGPQVPERKNAL
jgi:hypothetical protein